MRVFKKATSHHHQPNHSPLSTDRDRAKIRRYIRNSLCKKELHIVMVDLNRYRLTRDQRKQIHAAPVHLRMHILRHLEQIPKKSYCKVIQSKGPHKGEICGRGYYRGAVCYIHRRVRNPHFDMSSSVCEVIITRGPRKGQACGKTACVHQRSAATPSTTRLCEYVFTRGPRKGEPCNVRVRVETKSGDAVLCGTHRCKVVDPPATPPAHEPTIETLDGEMQTLTIGATSSESDTDTDTDTDHASKPPDVGDREQKVRPSIS